MIKSPIQVFSPSSPVLPTAHMYTLGNIQIHDESGYEKQLTYIKLKELRNHYHLRVSDTRFESSDGKL